MNGSAVRSSFCTKSSVSETVCYIRCCRPNTKVITHLLYSSIKNSRKDKNQVRKGKSDEGLSN